MFCPQTPRQKPGFTWLWTALNFMSTTGPTSTLGCRRPSAWSPRSSRPEKMKKGDERIRKRPWKGASKATRGHREIKSEASCGSCLQVPCCWAFRRCGLCSYLNFGREKLIFGKPLRSGAFCVSSLITHWKHRGDVLSCQLAAKWIALTLKLHVFWPTAWTSKQRVQTPRHLGALLFPSSKWTLAP